MGNGSDRGRRTIKYQVKWLLVEEKVEDELNSQCGKLNASPTGGSNQMQFLLFIRMVVVVDDNDEEQRLH